jgi:hypothetical protein
MTRINKLSKFIKLALLPAGLISAGQAHAVEFGDVEITGYVRQHFSWNMADVNETAQDDKWDMSMNRQTILLQAKTSIGETDWTVIGRAVNENSTNYLDRLEDLSGFYAGLVGGPNADYTDDYEQSEIREFYVDFETGPVFWRVGRQQVVWGETDLFHPNDVIHGFDFTWRSIFEPENEEVRKPLWIVNATIDLSEQAGGSLQLIVQPGLDGKNDVGNTYDFNGGRWAQNGGRGYPLTSCENNVLFQEAPFNYYDCIGFDHEHKDGAYDDTHYGFRWEGNAGENEDLTYGISYYRGQALNPVVITDVGVFMGQEPKYPTGLAFIYQEVDTFGLSLSSYLEAIDFVYRLEVSYQPDLWYNDKSMQPINQDVLGLTPSPKVDFAKGGIVEHDTYNITIGLDTNVRLQNVLGTSSQSLLSFQFFDTYIDDLDDFENLNNGVNGALTEHNMIATMKFTLPYANDTVTWDFTVLSDLSEGGFMYVPSVEMAFGEHIRVRIEGDFFDGGNIGGAAGPDWQSIVGSFKDSDQIMARLTYQF